MLKQIREGVKYQKLTEEEKKSRHILGRLVGTCADFINPTRNGRGYSEELWENVFNNDIMKEKIANRVCYGELGHPEDRTEIDMEKVAICLAEQPVKNSKGQLEAVFDILDTPNGRILKTLCDYGSTLGISSRGQGDLITDSNGNEAVDPDTYECECWDVVLIPAVKEARLKYVKEGLDTKTLKLKKALTEAFNKENEEGKKVMAETLKDINITLNESIAKEIKLSDCTKLETYEDASNICKKLHADKWAFGIEDEGFSNGKSIFDAYIKDGNSLYVYEDKENSFAFLLSPNKEIKLCCDLSNKSINPPTILTSLEVENSNDEAEGEVEKAVKEISKEENPIEAEEEVTEPTEETEEVTESLINEDKKKDEKDALSLDIDLNGNENSEEIDTNEENTEDGEDNSNENSSKNNNSTEEENELTTSEDEENSLEDIDNENEEPEEDERSDEEIFINYLVDNFEPDQIEEACKALGIDLSDLTNSEDSTENKETVEDEESKEMNSPEDEESSVEDISSKEDEATEDAEEVIEATDNGSNTIINNLKEALKSKSDLEMLVKTLQEQTAVSDAKVNELTEQCNKYKNSIARLATIAKSNKTSDKEVSKLEESLKEKDDEIQAQQLRIKRLVEARKQNLNESVSKSNNELKALKEDYETKLQTLTTENDIKIKAAAGEIKTLKENLTKTQTLKESYKDLANKTMNLLIEEKAKTLGLTSIDIKRKLGSSYTIDDVQKVCEELKRYQLNVSKLPFSVDKHYGVKVNESVSKQPVQPKSTSIYDDDDYVSDSLIRLANNGRW